MFCPKCDTESSSSPRHSAFEEIGDRSNVMYHPFISSVVVYTAEMEVAMSTTILCNNRTKDLCYQTFKSTCKGL
jgi:hypothetical protein